MSAIQDSLTAAVAKGDLLDSAKTNIIALLEGSASEVAPLAIQELVDGGNWEELNDRFFKLSQLLLLILYSLPSSVDGVFQLANFDLVAFLLLTQECDLRVQTFLRDL